MSTLRSEYDNNRNFELGYAKDSEWVLRAECNLPSHLSFAGLARFEAPGQGFCVSGKVKSRVNSVTLVDAEQMLE